MYSITQRVIKKKVDIDIGRSKQLEIQNRYLFSMKLSMQLLSKVYWSDFILLKCFKHAVGIIHFTQENIIGMVRNKKLSNSI